MPNSASGTTFDAQIKNGGTAQLSAPGASVRRMRAGVFAGGGHLEVNGGGLTVTEDLILNFAGTSPASTTVQLGGTLSARDVVVGHSSTGFSNFLITGAESTVNVATTFTVGLSGGGALALAAGGELSNVTGTIARNAGSVAGASVSGAGSVWTNTDGLIVGWAGNASLTVQGEGAVLNTFATIGVSANSTGTAYVLGPGSTWTNSQQLLIGQAGEGFLNVLGGGNVSNTYAELGVFAGSTGTATVDGAGSAWNVSGQLNVGMEGTGYLTVMNGGHVATTGSASLGDLPGSHGAALVDGPNSNLEVAAALIIGGFEGSGVGSLAIRNGGHVTNDLGYLGYSGGSSGTVTVDGVGSTWTNNNRLFVGTYGYGSLVITGGGQVTSNDDASIGYGGDGGSGVVEVSGAGSNWTVSDIDPAGLYVGVDGTGILSVNTGGVVTANVLNGVYIGGQGTVRGNSTIDGRIVNYGLVSPGAFPGTTPGTLTITGQYWQGAEGSLAIEIASAASYDKLDFLGGNLDGTLDVTLLGGYVPSIGASFDLLDTAQFGVLNGSFATINLPLLPVALAWDASQLYTTGVLSVVNSGFYVSGDFNQDGPVNAADYVVWRKTDGFAGGYNRWREDFGTMAGSSGLNADALSRADTAVPEPAAWMMALGTLCLVALSRISHGAKRRATANRLLPRHVSRVALFSTLAIAFLQLAGSASAQTIWNGTTGPWSTATNWSAGVPNASVSAQINNGGTANVFGDSVFADVLYLGLTAGSTGNLRVFSIGGLPGVLTVSNALLIGHVANGSMRISGIGSVNNPLGVIGGFGFGTVEVVGPNATWSNSQELHVGNGTLTISGGGTVNAVESYSVGDGNSTTMVTGAGSKWVNNNIWDLGSNASAVVTIADGGLVSVGGQATIGATDTVHIGAGGVAGTLQAGSVANNGTLHFNHTGAETFAVPLFGAGNVLKDGAGTTTLTSPAGYTGRFTAQAGRLILQGGVNPASTLIANNGGTLRLDGAVVSLGDIVIRPNADGTIEYFNATLNGGFLRGPGTHVLLAGGATTLNGVTTFNSATIVQDGTDNFQNLTNGGTLTNNATLYYDGGVNAPSGIITVNGTLFTQDFTNNGVVTINNGGVLQTDASSLVSGGGSRTTVNAGGEVFISDGTTWELNGALLVNNGFINGTTNVNYGSLATGSGSYGLVNVNQGGILSPGNSPGNVIAESLHLANTSILGGPVLAIELGGTEAGSQHDHVNVTDALSLGGTLNVSLLPGFTPSGGQSFDILDWSTLSGTFSAIQLPTLAGALAWNTSELYVTGVLSVVAPGVPGDYNNNSVVDAADYVVWRKTDSGNSQGYTDWRESFGEGMGAGGGTAGVSSSQTGVPEPTTLVLLMFAAAGWSLRRRGFA